MKNPHNHRLGEVALECRQSDAALSSRSNVKTLLARRRDTRLNGRFQDQYFGAFLRRTAIACSTP